MPEQQGCHCGVHWADFDSLTQTTLQRGCECAFCHDARSGYSRGQCTEVRDEYEVMRSTFHGSFNVETLPDPAPPEWYNDGCECDHCQHVVHWQMEIRRNNKRAGRWGYRKSNLFRLSPMLSELPAECTWCNGRGHCTTTMIPDVPRTHPSNRCCTECANDDSEREFVICRSCGTTDSYIDGNAFRNASKWWAYAQPHRTMLTGYYARGQQSRKYVGFCAECVDGYDYSRFECETCSNVHFAEWHNPVFHHLAMPDVDNPYHQTIRPEFRDEINDYIEERTASIENGFRNFWGTDSTMDWGNSAMHVVTCEGCAGNTFTPLNTRSWRCGCGQRTFWPCTINIAYPNDEDDDYDSDEGLYVDRQSFCLRCVRRYIPCERCDNFYRHGSSCACIGTVINAWNYVPSRYHVLYNPEVERLNRSITYGVELETHISRGEADAGALRIRDWLTEGGGKFRHSPVPSPFYMKHDGSIGNGVEIVSHPFTWQWLMHNASNMEAMFDVIAGVGTGDHDSCGMHVHIGKRNLTKLTLFKMFRFIDQNKAFVQYIAGRRGNTFCQYHSMSIGETSRITRAALPAGRNPGTPKYVALNVRKAQTVELRVFRGVNGHSQFMRNMEFVDAFVHFCRTQPMNNMYRGTFTEFVDANSKMYNGLMEHIAGLSTDDVRL